MASKVSVVPLKTAIEKDVRIIDALLRDQEIVICLNRKTGKTRSLHFKALYDNNNHFWLSGESSWEYYIDGLVYEKLFGKTADSGAETSAGPGPVQVPDGTTSTGFGPEYFQLAQMSLPDRIEHIRGSRKRLDKLMAVKPPDFDGMTEALVDTSRDAALINRATLLEAIRFGDEEAKLHTQDIVESTQELVRSTARVIAAEIFRDELMNVLVMKSNGTVIQHMTRVFLNGVSFLSYYNDLVSHSSIVNKLRIAFEKKYKKYYMRLLPHLHADDLTLERVFYKGLRAIPELEFQHWCTGFLIHDIGKVSEVEYHEGESAYDRNVVVDHIKIGYNAVMKKTDYPREAGLITGYHHEYYDSPAGYGYFRAYLSWYKKENPRATRDYCITFELEPIMDYQAMAYFPAKVLEIVDIFDSVTDPNRKNRNALSPERALVMMREEFIEKNLKLDPVLFDLFENHIREKIAKRDRFL